MADGMIDTIADELEVAAEVTRRITGKNIGFLSIGLSIGVVGGFATGYVLLNKRLRAKYDGVLNSEVEEMREHYHQRVISLENQAQTRRPLEEIVVERGYVAPGIDEDALRRVSGGQKLVPVPDELLKDSGPVSVTNVFHTDYTQVGKDAPSVPEPKELGWDYAVETRRRVPGVPYIIHRDEFTQNEVAHEQECLTYFEGDDVLADRQDSPIDTIDETVGLDNLARWGHGSGNPNIIYVRNEEQATDYEVTRDGGSFTHHVMPHLRHSSGRRERPQRGYDDD